MVVAKAQDWILIIPKIESAAGFLKKPNTCTQGEKRALCALKHKQNILYDKHPVPLKQRKVDSVPVTD